jgi:hypothetical protein
MGQSFAPKSKSDPTLNSQSFYYLGLSKMTNVYDFIIVGGEYISGLSSSLCYLFGYTFANSIQILKQDLLEYHLQQNYAGATHNLQCFY